VLPNQIKTPTASTLLYAASLILVIRIQMLTIGISAAMDTRVLVSTNTEKVFLALTRMSYLSRT